MNLSGIRISAGFYDYNSIENRAVTVGSELPAELRRVLRIRHRLQKSMLRLQSAGRADRIREPSITRTATSRMQSTS